MMGGYFLAWFICKQFIWYDYSPFYSLLKTLQMLSPVIVLVVMAVGSITFMTKAIEKPLEYLDTVIDASKTLSEPEAPAISLPEELSDVERAESGANPVSGKSPPEKRRGAAEK